MEMHRDFKVIKVIRVVKDFNDLNDPNDFIGLIGLGYSEASAAGSKSVLLIQA